MPYATLGTAQRYNDILAIIQVHELSDTELLGLINTAKNEGALTNDEYNKLVNMVKFQNYGSGEKPADEGSGKSGFDWQSFLNDFLPSISDRLANALQAAMDSTGSSDPAVRRTALLRTVEALLRNPASLSVKEVTDLTNLRNELKSVTSTTNTILYIVGGIGVLAALGALALSKKAKSE